MKKATEEPTHEPTLHFSIHTIELVASDFKFCKPGSASSEIEASGSPRIEYFCASEHADVPASDHIGKVLTVAARGMMDKEVIWTASATYLGVFRVQTSQVSQEAIDSFRNVNAPAILYGFAREHLADVFRRAGFGSIHIPLMNFVGKKAFRAPAGPEKQ